MGHQRRSCRRPRATATRWVGVALAAVLPVAGCGAGPEPDAPSSTSTRFDALAQPARVPVIARERLGEAPKVRRISLSHSGFSMEVRDPAKPENLDTYRYDGDSWTSTPVSVTLREIKELDTTTFGLGAVAWDAVPGLMQRALDGLDLEGEEVTNVSYDRLPGDPPRVYIGVTGLRGSGWLHANADGTEVEISRN